MLGLAVIVVVEVASSVCNEDRNGKSCRDGVSHVTSKETLNRAANCGAESFWGRMALPVRWCY